MMSRRENSIAGRRYGRLVAVKRDVSITKEIRWRCRCDCGMEVTILKRSLTSGRTRSCGCMRAERMDEINKIRHGKSTVGLKDKG